MTKLDWLVRMLNENQVHRTEEDQKTCLYKDCAVPYIGLPETSDVLEIISDKLGMTMESFGDDPMHWGRYDGLAYYEIINDKLVLYYTDGKEVRIARLSLEPIEKITYDEYKQRSAVRLEDKGD